MDLAEYLFRRVHELGVRGVHGVPGDYNLAVLDYVSKAGLNWIGNCNELNAGKLLFCLFFFLIPTYPWYHMSPETLTVDLYSTGYAADGYSRVKGIGAIVTTFGVGELSAVNALAGAYSEFVPIIHIVGTPSTISQKNGMLLHHTLGNGMSFVYCTTRWG